MLVCIHRRKKRKRGGSSVVSKSIWTMQIDPLWSRLQNFHYKYFFSLVSKYIHDSFTHTGMWTCMHLYSIYIIFLTQKPHTHPLIHNFATEKHSHTHTCPHCCIDGHASARSLQNLSCLKSLLCAREWMWWHTHKGSRDGINRKVCIILHST